MRFAILILLLCTPVYALEWSEIFFNPIGRDNGKEFVELTGDENLAGCTVEDSKSSDKLELIKRGSEIILIVESDGNFTEGTIYSAGKAIGNGLGNTQDSLTIACNGTVILNTSYNVTEIPGFKEGHSILFNGTWVLGPLGGTPGNREVLSVVEEPPIEKTGGGECNSSLAVTVSKKEGYEGDVLFFTIITEKYASFEARIKGKIISSGDTSTTKEHFIILPNESVKLTAYQESCNGKQRATRYIKVKEIIKQEAKNESVEEILKIEDLPKVKIEKPEEQVKEIPTLTGHVVVDNETNVVPWISAFGIVTLIVSAGLFLHISKSEDQ